MKTRCTQKSCLSAGYVVGRTAFVWAALLFVFSLQAQSAEQRREIPKGISAAAGNQQLTSTDCPPTVTQAWATLNSMSLTYDIAIDASGNVYTVNEGRNNVSKITPDGVLTEQWATLPLLSMPRGIAIDASGNVYTTNYGNSTISKITPAGVVTQTWATLIQASFPYGIAIDASGNVYTANNGNRTVSKITPAGGVTQAWASLSSGAQPVRIAIDASGNVYTANQNSTVSKITSAGVVTDAWATLASGALSLGIDIDASGNVYTANFLNHTVSKITPAGVVTQTWAALASGAQPFGMTIDASGNVYTANAGNHTVSKITPAGVVTQTWAALASGSVPYGIAISASGNFYTANRNGTVSKIAGCSSCPTLTAAPANVSITNSACNNGTASGGSITAPAPCPTGSTLQYNVNGSGWTATLPTYNQNGPAQSIQTRCNCDTDNTTSSPASAAVTTAPEGCCPNLTAAPANVSIVNSTCNSSCLVAGGSITAPAPCPAGSTLQYNVNGSGWTATLPTYNQNGPAQSIQTRCNCDSDNTTSSPASAAVTTAPADCDTGTPTVTLAWATLASGAWPRNVAIDASGNVYTTNSFNNTVSKITPAGVVTQAWVTLASGSAPWAIAIDASGNIYTTNDGTSTVSKITPAGGLTQTWATLASGAALRGIAIDASGNVYTTNQNPRTVSKITPAGVVTQTWATLAQLSQPVDLVIDASGNVYTANAANHTVSKITPAGVVTQVWATLASGAGPRGIAIDASDNIYTANRNGTVSKITPAGAVTQVWAALASGAEPANIVVDNASGNVYTVNDGNDTVSKITSAGVVTQAWATLASGALPRGVATDALGNVYTANQGSNTVTKISRCPSCPTLTAAPANVSIVNSTCNSSCQTTGGSITAPTGTPCPAGSTLQYNVNNTGWTSTLPTYAGPAQSIRTRCNCNSDNTTSSPASTAVTTAPGTCTTPAAPSGTLAITNSTCANCTVGGGSIAIGSVSGTGGTLQYSTNNGGTWSSSLPTYNQTGPAQTILASVLGSNGCRSNATVVGATVPGTCTTPSAPSGALAITNSTCTNCTVGGGSIAIGSVSGTGGTLQYSTDNGATWSSSLPTYNQTGPAQTILASVLPANGCRSNTTAVGTTVPGTCTAPGAPNLIITNNVCPSTPGTISATGCGAGTVVEYATNSNGPWSTTAPAFTTSAFTVYARCRNTTTNCIGQVMSAATAPVACCPNLSAAPGNVVVNNGICNAVCQPVGASISVPTLGCPSGSAIQYSVNNGAWSSTLPTYADGQTIRTRCVCDNDPLTISPVSSGATTNAANCLDNTPPMINCSNTTVTFSGEATLTLNAASLASASDNCGTPTVTLSTTTVACAQVGQTAMVTVTATDAAGLTANCVSQVTIGGLPCGWSQDPDGIGCAGGNDVGFMSGVFSINSTGCYSGPPFTADAAGFAGQELCGNGSITAQVTSLNGGGWAGITIRESDAPGARKVQLMTNLATFNRREARSTLGGSATFLQFSSQNKYWLRLLRQGNQFVGYTSSTGDPNWSQVFVVTINGMPNCLEVGLAVTNNTATGSVSATFANVNIMTIPMLANIETTDLGTEVVNLYLDIFPNPTSGEVTVDFTPWAGQPALLEVYNLQGRRVRLLELDEANGPVPVDMSNLPGGVYLFRVGEAQQRVVLQR